MATISSPAKQLITTFVRQTKLQPLRGGKPQPSSRRAVVTAAAVQRAKDAEEEAHRWRQHHAQPAEPPKKRARIDALRNEQEPRPFSSFLTDNYSRQHNYLRISVTERCNLRCVYCMPEEGVPLSPVSHNLTSPEIVYLSELFVKQGVDKIRLTGGEPTVRRDIVELMQEIGQLRRHGLKELCITSNGISLHRKLDSMVESGLTGVNLSLDTLDPFQFTLMTRRKGHDAVMKSINRILEMNKLGAGIKLKINCVVMRGINEREILPFVELGQDKDLEVRFIEYMPFDGNKWSEGKMLSFKEMLALIRSKYPDVHKVDGHANDTSKTYQIPGFRGRIGFITSMTHNFCGTCNRLRITSDGNLKVCLFGNSEVSLRDILRESNHGNPIDADAMEALRQLESTRQSGHVSGTLGTTEREARLLDVIGMAVKRKKEKHAGMGELENMKNRPMILIDGLQPPSALPSTIGSMNLQHSTRAVPSMHAKPRLPHQAIPLHLLQLPQPLFSVNQQRHKSTFIGRRTFTTWKRIRYTAPFHGVRYTKSAAKQENTVSDFRSFKLRRRVERVRSHFVGARRRLGFLPSAVATRSGDDSAQNPAGTTPQHDGKSDTGHLTHLRQDGSAHMVNISEKKSTTRVASAVATLFFSDPKTFDSLAASQNIKGDAVAVARVAAIQAVKRTAELIPLAHPSLNITGISVDIKPFAGVEKAAMTVISKRGGESTAVKSSCGGVTVRVRVECQGKTGIEMEAITGATIGAVTLYDMLKAVDKAMVISGARVVEKKGGKSGDWRWNENKGVLEHGVAADVEVTRQPLKQSPTVSPSVAAAEHSDVTEWNQGLAGEFSIQEQDGEQQKANSGLVKGARSRSATSQSSPYTGVRALPNFPTYRSKHLEVLRSQELRKLDGKFEKRISEACSVKEATEHEKEWNAATQAVVDHYSRVVGPKSAPWKLAKRQNLDRDFMDESGATEEFPLEEAKQSILARQREVRELEMRGIESGMFNDTGSRSSRDMSSEQQAQQKVDRHDFVERNRRRYAEYLRTGIAKPTESQG